jgi:hypothetical protein
MSIPFVNQTRETDQIAESNVRFRAFGLCLVKRSFSRLLTNVLVGQACVLLKERLNLSKESPIPDRMLCSVVV